MNEWIFLSETCYISLQRNDLCSFHSKQIKKILAPFGSQATLPCTYYAPGTYYTLSSETGSLTFLGKGKGTLRLCFYCKTLHTKQHSAPLTLCGTHLSPGNAVTFTGLTHTIRTFSGPCI